MNNKSQYFNDWSYVFFSLFFENEKIKFNLRDRDFFYTQSLSKNENITWDIIKKNPNIKWDYIGLSKNPNITMDIIWNNPHKDWYPELYSTNINVTWDIIQANPDKKFSYNGFSSNLNITWDIVINNPNISFNYEALTVNPSIPIEIILANPDKPWRYDLISNRKDLTWEIVQGNPQIRWNLSDIIKNNFITWDIIKNDIQNLYGSLQYFTYNKNITLDIIKDEKYKYVMWAMEGLSMNESITWKDVCDNPKLRWNYCLLPLNPNISLDIILDNYAKPWTITTLFNKSFKKEREEYFEFRDSQKNFINTISDELMSVVWHPKNIHKFKYL